jgi:aspartyl-tRNA(Asn)/glutamyl-tRNA(Gln) amidotransferase subunit B
MKSPDDLQADIGLEVHVQLLTQRKVFAPETAVAPAEANHMISEVSLAYPGTLPRFNKVAVEMTIRTGLALGSTISPRTVVERKNYFYPDLPKGYQLSQHRFPVCLGGVLTVGSESGKRDVHLHHIHVEEDAGKSMHDERGTGTRVDFNRAGVALMEVVTEPDMHTPGEAGAFLSELRKLVRFLGVCDGNMEAGSLRCDANISVRRKEDARLGNKVEVKNLNSIRSVERALRHEFERQAAVLVGGGIVTSETRSFDAVAGTTAALRTKEELNDYRYFPDPDIPPVSISPEWVAEIASAMPALPASLSVKFIAEYGLSAYDSGVLTELPVTAHYFNAVCAFTNHYKAAGNWIMGPVKAYLNASGSETIPIAPVRMAELIDLVESRRVSHSVAVQQVFPEMLINPGAAAAELLERMGLHNRLEEAEISHLIDQILKELPLKVEEYRRGKKNLLAMFMGELMKRSSAKVDPRKANEMIKEKLNQ